jgi:hypothetical protein
MGGADRLVILAADKSVSIFQQLSSLLMKAENRK